VVRTSGYEDLRVGAERFELDGTEVMVASLADVIRSKRAADRKKDREALPVLEELARQIAARSWR
jgi:predicted nucleotidyltransferase